MTKQERKIINGLKGNIKRLTDINTNRASEIRYLRLQLSRIRNEIGKILDIPSSIRGTREMKGLKSTKHKRVTRTLRRK